MKFWELPEKDQRQLIAGRLSKYGKMLEGEIKSPHSTIYTFDRGQRHSPRYTIAKSVRINTDMDSKEIKLLVRRALDEINNAYSVYSHYLIHNFFDIHLIDGIPFLMSTKRSQTLFDLIQSERLDIIEILNISIQLTHALNYLNIQGIISHQDLKPENIYIDSWPVESPFKYLVRVADFELSNAFLKSGKPYGSRPYMAPEQYVDSIVEMDFSKVDVFAFAVILYEMFTAGIHPIGQEIALVWPTSQLSKKWNSERPWKKWAMSENKITLTDASKRIDQDIFALIKAALETDISSRITIVEIENKLREILKQKDTNAYEYLEVNLKYFDKTAAETEILGWPYYEDVLKQVNQSLSS